MNQSDRISVISMVIFFAAILQSLLIFADNQSSPHTAVIKFAKAYFLFDADAMSSRICKANQASKNMIDKYVYRNIKEAKDRGVAIDYLKSRFTHIDTEIISSDGTTASIRVTGIRRISVNPLYGFIAKIFQIGESYKVDQIFSIVKEAEEWKICGNPFPAL
jgi:hypothetical protein